MVWGWSISKKDLLERQYNLSKEVEFLNKELSELSERLNALEDGKNKKNTKKKPAKRDTKETIVRKSEKAIDNAIAKQIEKGYLLLTKTEKNGTWTAKMEKAA